MIVESLRDTDVEVAGVGTLMWRALVGVSVMVL